MDFQSEKSFGKLRLRAFQPYHQTLCILRHVEDVKDNIRHLRHASTYIRILIIISWALFRESRNIDVLLKKHMVWKIVELFPKVPFQFMECVEIRREIPFSSSILHNLMGTYMYV